MVFLFKRHLSLIFSTELPVRLTVRIICHLQNVVFVTTAMLPSPCCKGEGSISDSLLKVIQGHGSDDRRRSAYFNHYLPSGD